MSVAPYSDNFFQTKVRSASRGLFWLGLAMAALGIAAIVFPIASTLATAMFVGWMLPLYGGITLFGSFSIHGTGPFFSALVTALLAIGTGVFLLLNPVAGAVALTLIVATLFMLEGAFEISFAFEMLPHAGWVGLLISGIISIVAAVLIVAAWPAISMILLGILFGINFASTGIACMMVAHAVKSAD